jgi:hypothetical protein
MGLLSYTRLDGAGVKLKVSISILINYSYYESEQIS